ncbi:MAG: hypothetical protein AAF500_15655 [Myxococcota bacterium]
MSFRSVDLPATVSRQSDGRRRRTERSRLAVIEASLAMALATKRIPTARQVAERVSLTERTIFNLFNGKQEIMFAAVLAFRVQALARLPEVPNVTDFEKRVHLFFEELAPLMEDYATVRWITLTASETVPDVERGVVAQALKARVYELLERGDGSSMPESRRAALHAAIDPTTWRIYRTQQKLTMAQSVRAVAASVIALTKE